MAILPLVRLLAVLGVDRIDHFHAFYYFAERRKPHAVEFGVVPQVDKELGRARIGLVGFGVRDPSARIDLLDGVVEDIGLTPGHVQLWIAAQTPLHHKARHHAEEALPVVKTIANQVVEAVGTERCPIACHFG